MKWFVVLCFMVDSLNPKTWFFYDVPVTEETCLQERERLADMLLAVGIQVSATCIYKRPPP